MRTVHCKIYPVPECAWLRRVPGVLVLLVIIWMPSLLSAAVTAVAPEWKAHLGTKPVIKNCVFEEILFSFPPTRTNLYHVRYQEDAFLFREIHLLEDASLDHIAGGTLYAGHFGSNYWAIEGGRVLKLFPDADAMIREFRSPEVSLIEAPRRKLIGALFYGFYLLDPDSVHWIDDSAFKASTFRNGGFRGDILAESEGLPTVIEWYAEDDPVQRFTTECKYLTTFDLSYYPSEISVAAKVQGKTIPVVTYRILALETSKEPLPGSWFDSARYFSPPSGSVPQVLMVTNDHLYARNADGGWEAVRAGPLPDLSGEIPNRKLSRAVIIGLVLFSTIPLFLAWMHARREEVTKR